ncbi:MULTISPECIES: GTP-binding protein [unclassified Moraxella]|uniref:GTP-binding protein n=1 Tax=unclassified Moraxella TaxID=2685852 RepID=UPI003AFA00AF
MTTAHEDSYKIIFAGPVGAGKTQAIQSLSDKPIVTTDEIASDETKLLKKTTTVAMDYGVMKLETGEIVRLYGTPGQRRFDFMWEILSDKALGLVLLVNATDADPVQDMKDYMQNFLPLIKSTTMVVGITHAEAMPWDLHQRLTDELVQQGIPANVVPVDARDKAQMAQLVSMLVYAII